jgi:Uma2 family endonuclease
MGQGSGKKPATYEDIEALPVGWVGELIEHELVALPRPATRHLRVTSRLGMLLGVAFDLGQQGPGGWWFLDEPELHFGYNVLVPDLAGWRRDRVPEPPSAPWLTVAPDWICEVLSPRTWAVDRARKMPLYYREGVGHAWLIDPARRTLEVYRSGIGSWERTHIFEGNGTVRVEPFEAVPLELGLLWLSGRPEREGHPSP